MAVVERRVSGIKHEWDRTRGRMWGAFSDCSWVAPTIDASKMGVVSDTGVVEGMDAHAACSGTTFFLDNSTSSTQQYVLHDRTVEIHESHLW